MHKLKQMTALVLSLVMLLGCVLVSCKKKEELPQDSETQSSDGSESTPAAEEILLADKGNVNFKMILSEYDDESVKKMITGLHSTLVQYTGDSSVAFENAGDSVYNADEYEILIGNTGYPESKAAMDELGYGEWTVRVVGRKIVIAGFSRLALNSAIIEMMRQIKDAVTEDGTIALSADLNITKTSDKVVNVLPRFGNGVYPWTLDEGMGTSLAILSDVDVTAYDTYIEAVKSAGYTFYASNVIGDNKFADYVNGEYAIHVGYYAYEKALRVTVGNNTDLPTRESDNVWTKNDSVVTSLAQLGIDKTDGTGMSYCYQLADGSFIVIDGGYVRNATTLYEYMKAKAPDGKIVIAAWFVSHNDGDHYSCFVEFVSKYKEAVEIQQLVFNYPSSATFSDLGRAEDTSVIACTYALPDCKVIKAHTGQKFYIRNAVVEMLYTVDSSLPDKMYVFNDTSMVFTVEVEGERALFMADAGDEVSEILVDMYGNYLRSDILQLAHHGMRNGHGTQMPHTIELYKLIRPEVVLWPSTDSTYLNTDDEDTSIAYMQWNLVALECARECYIAGVNITVLELPYTIYSAYYFDPNVTREPVCKDKPSVTDRMDVLVSCNDKIITRVNWNDTVVN